MVESRFEELERTCFVIMPFGTKEALGAQVDFDAVYHDVFSPAISEAVTPEHGALEPRRTDQDFFSGSINQEMFEYIVYSRLAFADISGLNPNVLYEIGVRHGVQAAGTVLFRQVGHPIPFDITTIKVFEYDMSDPDAARALVTRVVSESLANNRLDSPVRLALRDQWGGSVGAVGRSAGVSAVPGARVTQLTGGSVGDTPSDAASREIIATPGSRVVVTVDVE